MKDFPPRPRWAGYWTYVSISVFGFFILYLAANNRLDTWIDFLKWTVPQDIIFGKAGNVAPMTFTGPSTLPTEKDRAALQNQIANPPQPQSSSGMIFDSIIKGFGSFFK